MPSGYVQAFVGETGRYIVYYDVELGDLSAQNIGLAVVQYDENDGKYYLTYGFAEEPYTSGDNNKLWKVVKTEIGYEIEKGAIDGRIRNTFFAEVLSGYLTCDANNENGYMAFGNMDVNFLPRVSGLTNWNMEGDLAGISIQDYESIIEYVDVKPDGIMVDAYSKYVRMKAMFVNNGGVPQDVIREESVINESLRNGLWLFASIGLCASLIGVFKFKKKPE